MMRRSRNATGLAWLKGGVGETSRLHSLTSNSPLAALVPARTEQLVVDGTCRAAEDETPSGRPAGCRSYQIATKLVPSAEADSVILFLLS